ncbi:MAG: hypothetical protein ACI4CY_00535 [Candidatus Gastranaerophilaceae bacterium]
MANFMYFSRLLNMKAKINKTNAELTQLNNQQEQIQNQLAHQEELRSMNVTVANMQAEQSFATAVNALDPNSSTYNAEYLSLWQQMNTVKNQNSLLANQTSYDTNVLELQSTLLEQRVKHKETQLEQYTAELEKLDSANTDSTKGGVAKYKAAGQ